LYLLLQNIDSSCLSQSCRWPDIGLVGSGDGRIVKSNGYVADLSFGGRAEIALFGLMVDGKT
jgi:hypothetical protein